MSKIKQLIIQVFAGFLFGIGVVLAIWFSTMVRDAYKDASVDSDWPIDLDSSKVVIESSRVVDFGQTVSIVVKVKNTLDQPFSDAVARVHFFDDKGRFLDCSLELDGFEVNETQEHIVNCIFDSDNLPPKYTYNAFVSEVRRFD